METLKLYLENLFHTLPDTPEVRNVKEDLALHMEEKYYALKAAGKTENEAIGIVISEFGNIDEIAAELGYAPSASQPGDLIVPEDEAVNFIQAHKKSHLMVAGGVFLCLVGVSAFMALSGLSITGLNTPILGLIVMMLFIALAVGLFIFSESPLKPFYFKEKKFSLSPSATRYVEAQRDLVQSQQSRGVAIGVGVILLGVVLLFVGMLWGETGQNPFFGVSGMLLLIGLGTAIIIHNTSPAEAVDILLQKGDFTPRKKKLGKISGGIASIWWPIATIVFFLWGFFGNGGFGRSWIVWPISGVLYGIISSLVSGIIAASSEKE